MFYLEIFELKTERVAVGSVVEGEVVPGVDVCTGLA